MTEEKETVEWVPVVQKVTIEEDDQPFKDGKPRTIKTTRTWYVNKKQDIVKVLERLPET